MKRLTASELEKLTPHQLADLLENVVLVLRRLPDVPLAQLKPIEQPARDAASLAASVRQDRVKRESGTLPDWLEESEE